MGSGQDKDKIYADGIDVDRNAAIDAKDNEGDFYTFDKYESKPFLFTGLEDEFRKYSLAIKEPNSPIRELIIRISRDDPDTKKLFEVLGMKYNVPTTVELFTWNE